MQLSIKVLGILFLGTSLLQASHWGSPLPEGDNSRSSSQGLSIPGQPRPFSQYLPTDASPYDRYREQSSGDESPVPLYLPPASNSAGFPPPGQHDAKRAAQLSDGLTSLQLIGVSQDPLCRFMNTLVTQGPLSPCSAADRLRQLDDGVFCALRLADTITPQSVMFKLLSDLEAITRSIENTCRTYLMAIDYPFSSRPSCDMGHSFLWTAMGTLGISLEDEQKGELDLVKFFEKVYGEGLATGPIDAHQVLSGSANKKSALQDILTSWGSSLNLSVTPVMLPQAVELFIGGAYTTSLLNLGHAACRYTHGLNNLSQRLAPQTPPLVQRVFYPENGMQDCA